MIDFSQATEQEAAALYHALRSAKVQWKFERSQNPGARSDEDYAMITGWADALAIQRKAQEQP